EVILNGDSLAPTRVIEGVVQPVAPTTAEQRLARKNELKAHGTLLMALLDKHQLKFNIHKDAKTLMEAIEKRNKTDLEDQSLDDLFNSLKIYEAGVKSSSSASTSTQNIAFVSSQNTDSTNEPVSAVASAKILIFSLSNVDTLSNDVIYSFFASQSNSPQLDNNNLKQIDADDLEEMDLKWKMAMLTVRARQFLQRTGWNLEVNRPTSMGFDMSKAAMTGAFRQKKNQPTMPLWHSPLQVLLVLTMSKSQFDVISYKTRLESVEARLLVYQQNETVSEKDIKLLKLEVQVRDNALVVFRQTLKKAAQERDDLKLKLEKFQIYSKNLSQILASQTNDKTGLGYNTQVFTSFMFDCDEMFSFETDESLLASPKYDRYHSGDGYHVVHPPYTGTFMPPKPDLVFYDAPNVNKTFHTAFNVELSLTKPDKELSHRPLPPIIEDWVSDSKDDSEAELPQNAPSFIHPTKQVKTPRPSVKPVENSISAAIHKTTIPKPNSHRNNKNRKACFLLLTKSKLVPLNTARQVTTAVSPNNVTRPRPATTVVTKPHSQPRRHINRSRSPKPNNFPLKVTIVKASMVNAAQGNWGILQHALKDKGVIDSGYSRHMTGNMSYLSDFEKINGGYVAFGGNPKGGKIFGKDTESIVLSHEFKLHDENHVLLRVPRENNMIKREFSVPRTPQQNGIAERKNRTLIEAARTMLADLLLPIPFWAEAVNTACYVQNRVLVTKLQNKTPYELLLGRTPSIGFMRPFGCPVTILNTLDPLEKAGEENVQQYVLFSLWSSGSKNSQNTDDNAAFGGKKLEFKGEKPESEVHVSPSSSAQKKKHDDKTKREAKGKSHVELSTGYRNFSAEFEDFSDNSINEVNATDTPVLTVGQILTNITNTFSVAELEDITYSDDEEDVGAKDDFTNLETNIIVSPILTTKVHKDHPMTQIIGDLSSATQTRSMIRVVKDQGGLTQINNEDFHTCMFVCFLSQEEPKRKVWVLVDLPNGKRAIGTKWIFRNKKDERCIVVRNKARLITQGHTQEEGIDYEEVFSPVARIEAISLFLAYASFMGFMVYQMDVKSAFLYGTNEEEVYVCQPPGFEDPDYPAKVYKVVKALYGLHQAPRSWYETLANYRLENGFQRGKIDHTLFIKRQKGDILLVQVYVDDIIFGSTNKDLCKDFEKLIKDKFQMSLMGELTFYLGLQVKHKPDGIFISQDKYVAEILRKFGLIDRKLASTPIETDKHLLKDPDGEDVDVHTYRSMIGSLMYLTSSRPDIMFAVCALAYSDSDYAGTSLDRKSTTGGCQFLGCRLISWQCKKQTVMATSSTEAEYVVAANSIDCLPNEEIFTELSRMGYKKPSTKLTFYKAFFSQQWKFLIHTILQCMSVKRTSWNEFSSFMALAIICLSTSRKFNFSKYFFDSLVRNVDSSTKFYMYPQFLQLMIRAQVGGLSFYTTKYSSPALTQKVFDNMRRVGKGFSRVETPLFEGMIMAQQANDVADEGAAGVDVDVVPAAKDKVAQALEIIKLKQRVKKLERKNKLKVFGLRRLKKVRTAQRIDFSRDTVMDDVSKQGEIIAHIDTDEDVTQKDVVVVDKEVKVEKDAEIEENADDDELEPVELKEVVEVVTTDKLMTEVVTAASATITAATTPSTTATLTIAPSSARRRKGLVIRDPKETAAQSIIIHTETKSIDKGKGIMVEEPKPLKQQD
nr:hypothetical protein [Tanacetum cinerariifolium]